MSIPRTVTFLRGLRPTRLVFSNLPPHHDLSKQQLATARHCYRVLLREASYILDPWSKQYVKQFVQQKFRRPLKAVSPAEAAASRQVAYLVENTRKNLRQLVRANDGHKQCLEKLLRMTFARTGKRRHEILNPMLSECEYQDADKPPTLSPALEALLVSQIANQPPSDGRRNPRSLKALMPRYDDLNAWLQPIPIKRVLRKARSELFDKFDRVHVPLDHEHWKFLKGVVCEDQPMPAFPKFRPRAGRPEESTKQQPTSNFWRVEKELLVDDKATFPFANLERGKVSNQLQGDDDPGKNPDIGTMRNMTTRVMRRRYRAVFAQCSYMHHNKELDHWTIQWGHKVIQTYSRLWQAFVEDFGEDQLRIAKEHGKRKYRQRKWEDE
ncbi:Hypothetical protein D9617_18g033420 [Elsinoe fawcettii]|nr:Hypothetical protein D9617_18g033420 [Elsinoe fawcettii]